MFKKGQKLVKIVIVCIEVIKVVEKLNNIFFHPSKLARYKNTKLYKVIIYLIFLSIFSYIVSIIDIINNPKISLNDKERFSYYFDIDYDNLPNCSLKDNVYSCQDEESSKQDIGTFLTLTIVSDVDDKVNRFNTIKFTKDYVVINIGMERYIKKYDELPKEWQEFDFGEIKNSQYPDDELFKLFIGGFNQIVHIFVPYIIMMIIFVAIVVKTIEILFYSILFYLFFRHFRFKYLQIFKLTVFAQSLPVTLTVILKLLGVNFYFTIITTFLTFLYMYIAMLNSVPKNREF